MHDPTPRTLARRRQVGARIRTTRLHWGLTQERLAELSGLSRQTIWRVEHGERSAHLDWLGQIADALQVPLAELVREDDEAPDAEGEGVGGG